jgi:hypothetical protein
MRRSIISSTSGREKAREQKRSRGGKGRKAGNELDYRNSDAEGLGERCGNHLEWVWDWSVGE